MMRWARGFLFMLVAGFGGHAAAQSIFNVPTAQPRGAEQKPVSAPAWLAPTATQQSQPSGSPLVDPKVMAQFEQLPNESNDAYLNRLKALADRAVADMERATREHSAKMKALAPK